MPTVAENLLALDAVKDEIKAKIGTNLGRTIGADVPFTDYADYIIPPATWMPDPLWPTLDDTADGEIQMIVRDRDDAGVAARCAFTITATADYTVNWGDGTTQTIASGTMADHTYTIGAGTADSKGTSTFKVRISSTGTITRIQMASVVTGGNVNQTVQSVEIKASGITTMESAFRYCRILQRVGDLNLPSCTNMTYAFLACASLVYIGAMTLPACTLMAQTFNECASILSIGNLNIPECITLASMAYMCSSLKSVGAISAPKCATINALFFQCRSLSQIGDVSEIGTSAASVDGSGGFYKILGAFPVNTPNAKYTKIDFSGDNSRYCGITWLTFHASSTFSGSSPQINVSYTMMNRTALVALFNLLPTLSSKTINITGAIGAADLTAGDRAIATGKGWTITG